VPVPEVFRHVRVVEYEVSDLEGEGKGELIALVATITDPRQASAGGLAQTYHRRWSTRPGTGS
jgi:hypothetical protein